MGGTLLVIDHKSFNSPLGIPCQSPPWSVFAAVGQATPMTYRAPETGRQYGVIVAGGARQSPDRGDYVIADLLEEQHQSGVIATDASTCELPAILFDTLFSHLTTRTVMPGQTCTANAFQPMIQELIALVMRRLQTA